jgi:KUP system potassium uptake protein
MKLAFPPMVRPARPPVQTPAPAAAPESDNHPRHQDPNSARGLAAAALSLGALGVVYGDIGTSPLYTVQTIFAGDHPLKPIPANVYGTTSLIVWSLVMVVTLKYVLLVMRADNHGEGGIMALVALISRTVKSRRKGLLVLIGILGASLFYGDGMITPAISVLSAVAGLQVASPGLASEVVPISLAVLVALFVLQRFGTGAVGTLFGPIMAVWFLVIGVVGGIEVLGHPGILRALSPSYGISFLASDPRAGFLSLGAVVLAITGAEAVYADMGHFGRRAITRAWLWLVFPALVLNYMGQGALIMRTPSAVDNPFFRLMPAWSQLSMVVLATVATVIASQAVISGAFSLTQQAVQLGFLPRVSIRHTSQRVMGQIYVPAVNWFLLAAVVGLVLGFRSSSALASAYGIAVTGTFATNTLLAFVIFRVVWRKPLWMIIAGAALFLTIELTFFAANLTKVASGGWLPLVVGAIAFTILTTWHRGRAELARVMREGRVTVRKFINRMIDEQPIRAPGTAVFLTQSLDTVPTALLRNVEHNGVLHARVVLLKLEAVGIPHVSDADRLRIERLRLGFLGVSARYGYQDKPDVVAVMRLAATQGVDIDPDRVSYFVDHVSILPTGRIRMAPWRKRLFALLHQNSLPAARYYRIPPDRVFEVGAYVQL